jgi:hypothetical protein
MVNPIKAFKADLIYGASGTTKTSNIGRAALWYHQRTQKTTRLVSADGGGYDPVQSLVDKGIIQQPWPIRLWNHRVEAFDKACQGYWPEDVNNPESRLLPPTITSYEGRCFRCTENGTHKLVYGPSPGAPGNVVCPGCRATIGIRPIDVHVECRQYANPANDLRGVALIGIEGLTSMGDSILEYLMQTKASLSQDPAYTWVDGATNYSGGNMSYYGFVQNRLYEFVHKSHMIPFVERVIWTALEGKGEEEATRVPIFGPAIAGRKATGKAPQWFGNTLHFEMVQEILATQDENKQAQVSSKPVMYLRPHADAISKVPFQAKTRMPFQFAQELPTFMEADLAKLYQILEDYRIKAGGIIDQGGGDK